MIEYEWIEEKLNGDVSQHKTWQPQFSTRSVIAFLERCIAFLHLVIGHDGPTDTDTPRT